MTDQVAMVGVVLMLTVLGVSALALAVVFVGALIEAVLSVWPPARRRRQRRQAEAEAELQRRREAMEAAAAKEARRVRSCESMVRATLVEHLTEFADGWRWPDRAILAGMDTATLRELCTTVRARAEWSGRLPGELEGGWHVYRIRFADGAAYVGMTGRTVTERLTQHLNGDGSPRVRHRRPAGEAYRFDVLASGLTERVARRLERAEIAELARPLNLALPASGAQTPAPRTLPSSVRVYLARPGDNPMTHYVHVTADASDVTAALLSAGESPGSKVRLELSHAAGHVRARSILLELRSADDLTTRRGAGRPLLPADPPAMWPWRDNTAHLVAWAAGSPGLPAAVLAIDVVCFDAERRPVAARGASASGELRTRNRPESTRSTDSRHTSAQAST